MQRAKTLTQLFNQIAEVVAAEADANPAFGAKLDEILAQVPTNRGKPPVAEAPLADLPDVYIRFQEMAEEEFRLWVARFDLVTLKGIVKLNGFDPGRLSTRWTETDKFVGLIVNQVRARLKRGSSFISPKVEAKAQS